MPSVVRTHDSLRSCLAAYISLGLAEGGRGEGRGDVLLPGSLRISSSIRSVRLSPIVAAVVVDIKSELRRVNENDDIWKKAAKSGTMRWSFILRVLVDVSKSMARAVRLSLCLYFVFVLMKSR